MLIAVICIILSIIIAVVLWPKVTTMYGKCTVIAAIILVIAISGQYIKLTQKGFLEGFEVQMPELDSPEYSGDNSYMDKEEEAAVNGVPAPSKAKIHTISDLDAMAKSGARKPATPGSNAEKFNNIVQRDTGSEQSSVFNPQIIFVNKSSNKADIGFSSSTANVNSSMSMSGSIDEYLKPRGDIFATNEQNGGSNPYDWMKEFMKTEGSASGNQTASCPVSKPYAESDHGRVNMATLTNKTFVPGMAYTPPTNWYNADIYDRSCRRVCSGSMPDTRMLPIGVMDHGTPIFALEIGGDGTIAKTEEEVQYTNVGSILPKFEYREYVDCQKTPETTTYVPVSRVTVPNTSYLPTYTAASTTTTTYLPTYTAASTTSTTSGATSTTSGATSTTSGATSTTSGATSTTSGATSTTSGATSTTSGATSTTSGATSTTSGATSTTFGATSTTSGATSTTSGATSTTSGATSTTSGATSTTSGATSTTMI